MGSHIVDALKNTFDGGVFIGSHRATGVGMVPIDLTQFNKVDQYFDVVINAAGYGVVKTEMDLDRMMRVNYLGPASYLDRLTDETHWIQIGSAFEYELRDRALTEATHCYPRTQYGISKWMFSHYLNATDRVLRSTIIRPFAMYGPREDGTKLIPYLIESQLRRCEVPLSSGQQRRDYIYVKDAANWISRLVTRHLNGDRLPSVMNIGSGRARSLRELATALSGNIPNFESKLWKWGSISVRPNESDEFYNSSDLAAQFGFTESDAVTSFQETVDYYVKHS